MKDRRPADDAGIMTLTEIAGYLKVSEKTVVRLVQAGELPGTKVASQWRFLRATVDDWLNSRMYNLPKKDLVNVVNTAGKVMPLSELVTESRIVMPLSPGSKEAVLAALAAPLKETGVVEDIDSYVSLLCEREEMLSTAIGHGLAIPHIRDPREGKASEPCMVIGVCPKGMEFDAIDGRKVKIFALPCADSEATHLRMVALISLIFKRRGVFSRMAAAKEKSDVLKILEETDRELGSGARTSG